MRAAAPNREGEKEMETEAGETVISVHKSEKLKCDRCWNHVDGTGVHDYWPTYTICPRCVGTLLEIKWPPYILRTGELGLPDADYYICKDEAEWNRIKLGQIPLLCD